MDTHHGTSTIKQETDRDDPRNFHTCDFCLYRTKSIGTMLTHVRQHRSATCLPELFNCTKNSPDLYKCDSCYFETYLKVDLYEHTKITHENEEINQPARATFDLMEILKCYNCTKCSFQTYSWLVFMEHVYYRCTINRALKLDKNIQGHDKTNCKISELERALCLFKVKAKDDLKNLLESHIVSEITNVFEAKNKVKNLIPENIKWCCCEQCSYRTKVRSNLKRHIRRVHMAPKNIKWFECENCSFKATTPYHLKEHKLNEQMKACRAVESDHNYHKRNPDTILSPNLVIDISTDSEEEIDVVSLDDKFNFSKATLPTNPSTKDICQTPQGVQSKVPDKRRATSQFIRYKRVSQNHRRSTDSSDSEPKRTGKRNVHNSAERQRRVDMRKLFNDLKKLVPEVNKKQRASKIAILSGAAQCCRDLSNTYDVLERRVEYLQEEQIRQRALLSQLRQDFGRDS